MLKFFKENWFMVKKNGSTPFKWSKLVATGRRPFKISQQTGFELKNESWLAEFNLVYCLEIWFGEIEVGLRPRTILITKSEYCFILNGALRLVEINYLKGRGKAQVRFKSSLVSLKLVYYSQRP